MNLDEFRAALNQYRIKVSAEAAENKQPYFAIEDLSQLYASFDDAEREMADRVIGEWI